jgi:hypothetical protein
MNEWQYTNPFYEEGFITDLCWEATLPDAPWDPSKYDDPKDIARETYRLHEWQKGLADKIMLECFNEKPTH